jgi:hypothetical protein
MATFAEKTPNYNTPEGEQLIKVAIAFIVFQTVFLVLFYASKYIQSKDISGIEMTFFMPLGFIFCVGNSVLSIRKSTILWFALETCNCSSQAK